MCDDETSKCDKRDKRKGAYNTMIMRYVGLHGALQAGRQTDRPTTEYDNEKCT